MIWKKLLTGAALLTAVAVALGFIYPWRHGSETLVLPGLVEIQEVRLGSKIGGRVADIATFEGQLVKPGKLLVRFEAPELQAQLEQTKAKLLEAEAGAVKAKANVQRAEADLQQMRSKVYQTERDWARAKKLGPSSALTPTEYDMMQNAYEAAKSALGVGEAMIAQAKADVDNAKASVAEMNGKIHEIEANLAEAEVKAPELAVVEVLAVRKGDLVPPNQPIIRVLRAADLWIKVYVPETQLGKVSVCQKAEVTIDSYPGRRFPGTVIQVASESEFTPRNVQSIDERRHQVFAVKVQVERPANPEERIFKSGMAAEVSLPLREAP